MSNTRNFLRLVNIHERDFQKYSVDNGIYCIPVDEREEDRLNGQHNLIFRLCGGQLFYPDVRNPSKILDCGYGRGEWAVAVAEEYEDCEVTGIDIYTDPLPDQPDNLTLFGYNMNDRLNDPEVFQRNAYALVHSRFVGAGIKTNRWGTYVREMKALTMPNGWIQMMEYYPNIQSDSGLLSDESGLRKWYQYYATAMEKCNRDPRIGSRLQQLLADGGLRDIGGCTLHLPIGGWDSDPTKASIGRDSVEMIGELLDSLSIWPFNERLEGEDKAKALASTNDARAELEDATLKLYIPIYVAWGRRSSRG